MAGHQICPPRTVGVELIPYIGRLTKFSSWIIVMLPFIAKILMLVLCLMTSDYFFLKNVEPINQNEYGHTTWASLVNSGKTGHRIIYDVESPFCKNLIVLTDKEVEDFEICDDNAEARQMLKENFDLALSDEWHGLYCPHLSHYNPRYWLIYAQKIVDEDGVTSKRFQMFKHGQMVNANLDRGAITKIYCTVNDVQAPWRTIVFWIGVFIIFPLILTLGLNRGNLNIFKSHPDFLLLGVFSHINIGSFSLKSGLRCDTFSKLS